MRPNVILSVNLIVIDVYGIKMYVEVTIVMSFFHQMIALIESVCGPR